MSKHRHYFYVGYFFRLFLDPRRPDASSTLADLVSTKAGRQSTLGYAHGSYLSADGVQTTNSMVTQDTDKLFIQVRPPSWRNTYVLRLIVLDWEINVP